MRFLQRGLLAAVLAVMMGLGSLWAAAAPEIDSAALAARLKDEKNAPFLLDVREPEETAQGMIKGAVNIPLGALSSRLIEVPKDKPVVVICRSGHRSQRGAEVLLNNGYTKVESLKGGMMGWDSSPKAP